MSVDELAMCFSTERPRFEREFERAKKAGAKLAVELEPLRNFFSAEEYHQKYLEWNGDRFRKWAERIGSNTCKVVHAILASQRVEQQSYRSCMGLLKLADKYSAQRLEAACRKALSYTASPSYKSIKNILATGQDRSDTEIQKTDIASTQNKHAITRGADYYRR